MVQLDEPRTGRRPFQMPKPKRDWSPSPPRGPGITGLPVYEESPILYPSSWEAQEPSRRKISNYHCSFGAAKPQIASDPKEQSPETPMESFAEVVSLLQSQGLTVKDASVQIPISHEESTALMTSKSAGSSST